MPPHNVAPPPPRGAAHPNCAEVAVAVGWQQHEELEVSFLGTGTLAYRFDEREVVIPPGRVTVFWAGFPHELVRACATKQYLRLSIPIEIFLAWRLPDPFKRSVMAGQVITETDARRHALDLALFRNWCHELRGNGGAPRPWVLLELEARLGRLADTASPALAQPPVASGFSCPSKAVAAALLARHLAEHYTEPVRWEVAAQAAGLSPATARRCFIQCYGMTLHQYLLHLRMARARQLLANADGKIIDIAMEAGFPTLSNFYRTFEAVVGQTPSAYRKNYANREPA
jgi:AraC-like DNA-binding protein